MRTSTDASDDGTDRSGERTERGREAAASAGGCDSAVDRTDRAARRVERWRTEGWTTVVLERRGDDEWRATQRGVDVEGRGETAARAAAAYCRRVSGDV